MSTTPWIRLCPRRMIRMRSCCARKRVLTPLPPPASHILVSIRRTCRTLIFGNAFSSSCGYFRIFRNLCIAMTISHCSLTGPNGLL
eukprot:3341177-Pyramimonas_sp.AAC.1